MHFIGDHRRAATTSRRDAGFAESTPVGCAAAQIIDWSDSIADEIAATATSALEPGELGVLRRVARCHSVYLALAVVSDGASPFVMHRLKRLVTATMTEDDAIAMTLGSREVDKLPLNETDEYTAKETDEAHCLFLDACAIHLLRNGSGDAAGGAGRSTRAAPAIVVEVLSHRATVVGEALLLFRGMLRNRFWWGARRWFFERA